MKQLLAFALAVLIGLALTGCGGKKEEPTQPIRPSVPSAPQSQVPENPLPEQVIYEEEGIRITVKGMEENTMTGTNIRILVENGTNRNIAFSGDLFVVNGVTVPGYLYAQVAAGTKTNDAIEFYSDVLDSAGITAIGTIRAYDARIVDTDTFDTLASVPLELITAYGEGDFVPDESGVELFRGENITVIAQTVQEEFYGKTTRLLVKNGTGKDIIVEAEHVSVNGYTLDAWLFDTVVADTVRYCHLDLFETGLAENGIETIETISFRLNFLDAATYDTIVTSDVLTVGVKG